MTMVILAHHFLVRLRQQIDQRGGPHQQPAAKPPAGEAACLDDGPITDLPQALPPDPPRTPTLPQVRRLLRTALPLPVLTPALALALVAYWQRHNLAAYSSHRKRTLQQLTARSP